MKKILQMIKEGFEMIGIILVFGVPIEIYIGLWWLLGPSTFWQKFAMLLILIPFGIVECFWLVITARIFSDF